MIAIGITILALLAIFAIGFCLTLCQSASAADERIDELIAKKIAETQKYL
jgi:low affinity Fe/Cu permease